MILATWLTFIVEKSWKNMYFHLCFIVHKEALLVILVSSHATGRHEEENDKLLVRDKHDSPITCLFVVMFN